MAHPFFRAALAVLLVSSFVYALSAEEVARFYIKSGESFKLEPVSVEGKTYHLVKIDGNPSLVLQASGATYEAVTDRSQLEPIIRAYTQQVFEDKNFKKSAALFNESLPLFESVLGNCSRGGTVFVKSFPTRTIRVGKANIGLKYLIDNTQAYKTEKDAYQAFNASFPGFNDAYLTFIAKVKGFESLVAGGESDAVLEAASVIRSSTTTVKTRFEEVSTAYRVLSTSKELGGILNFTFYSLGEPLRCNANTNVTQALTRVENEFSDKAIQSTPQMTTAILAFNSERGSSASQGTAYAMRDEEYKKAESSLANVSTQFAGQGYTVELKALAAKKDALKSSLDAIKANGSASTFDAELAAINAQITAYQSVVASFKTAAAAVKSASDNVTAAQKRYGETDTRVQALNKELTGLKVNMSSAISVLSSGDAPKASSQFAAVSTKGSDVSNRASTLPPKGNDLDLTIIIGVVVLLAVLAGTVWYFRKMKAQQPKMGTE